MHNPEVEELEYPLQPQFFTCKICGETKDNLNGYNPNSEIYQTMIRHQVCYHCAYWIYLSENHPIGYEVIGGVLYDVHPYVQIPYNKIKGSMGKEFYIYKNNGSVLRTNNLWNLGQIPIHFLGQHPDTARFITSRIFRKMINDNHICNARGCWDRYHCFRYNFKNEINGPFNEVPASHKIGDEHCPSFVNIHDFKLR